MTLDPQERVADLDLTNNVYPMNEGVNEKIYYEGKTK